MNWLLSKEGLTYFMSNMGGVSMRTDVSVDTVRPLWRFHPGDKLFRETDESVHWAAEMAKICKQVIDEVVK